MSDAISTLDEWITLRDLSMQQIKERFSITDDHIRHNSIYIKLKNVTEMQNTARFPGTFYFQDGRFVMLYVGAGPALEQFDRKVLQEHFGGPGEQLPSRVSKRSVHHVYPEQGVAFSEDKDGVSILEIFPPMTLGDYHAKIYHDPGPFIK